MQEHQPEPFYDDRDHEWQIGEYVPEFEYRDLDEPPEVLKGIRCNTRTSDVHGQTTDKPRLRQTAAELPTRSSRQGGAA